MASRPPIRRCLGRADRAGGKTLASPRRWKKGYVIACDVSEGRLKRAAKRARGAGLHNIETRPLASESDRWVKRHKAGFDRVLVDAPCSGTGTWRRKPDARWREAGAGLQTLLPLQARILASAARLVKPGGRLVYATCSLLAEENEAQVEGFLAAYPGFRVVPRVDRDGGGWVGEGRASVAGAGAAWDGWVFCRCDAALPYKP